MPEDLEKILFAVDSHGHIMPIYASGPAVEWHVYEDTETDWNDVCIAGIPATAGFYVWEGIPKADTETEEGVGTYCIGYEYSNSWRPLDQIEWLSLMEGVCPWSSKRNEEQEVAKSEAKLCNQCGRPAMLVTIALSPETITSNLMTLGSWRCTSVASAEPNGVVENMLQRALHAEIMVESSYDYINRYSQAKT